MRIEKFISYTDFSSKTEIDRVILLGYFLKKHSEKQEFSLFEVSQVLIEQGFSKPNNSRLGKKVKATKKIIKGNSKNTYKLHHKTITEIENNYPILKSNHEEIITHFDILPESLILNIRGYIIKLAIQINASYENNIIDGCALLMRRLLEVLLILGYENINKESDIKDNLTGQYKNLSFIINYTISNRIFSLSKDSYECIDKFRKLGNFSAHRIQYNCRKPEIEKVKMEYRVLIEELLYKSGVKK